MTAPRAAVLSAAVLIAPVLIAAGVVVAGCGRSPAPAPPPRGPETAPVTGSAAQQRTGSPGGPYTGPPDGTGQAGVTSWVYQLQRYDRDRLDALARSPHQLAVIDLARDAHTGFFTRDEIATVRGHGKRVLAYFEIGSMEEYRPEYATALGADLLLNRWAEWPQERFARYWDERWWQRVVRPRLDQALRAGFDGVYLDTPLAYEQIDLTLLPGTTRERLATAMAALMIRISRYAKARHPGFWIVPQNSPELRLQPGYLAAIDGIGMEELFYRATDQPCRQDYCAENLANARAVRDAGKLVLAVDYASRPGPVRDACSRYRREGFAGYPAVLALDRISPPCG